MNGSRTPSPLDSTAQQSTADEKPGDIKAGSDSSTSSTSNSPETGESRLAADVKKEEPSEDTGALMMENGLPPSSTHPITGDSNLSRLVNATSTATATNGLSKVTPPKAGTAVDKKPVAKVEPLLDPAHHHHHHHHHGLATRKSGVDGQMELLKKRTSPETTPSKQQMKSKMTAKLARVPADNPSGDPTTAGEGKQGTSGAGADEADECVDDSPSVVPVKEEYVCGGAHFRRVIRRMGGRNQCARTDLVYERMNKERRPDPLATREQQMQLSQQQAQQRAG